ncbi:malonic semialdehyde reductase [Cellulomonas pakistanensis]|uniref:Nitroreductase family protein n=1 Tax=Cellulomonas pakistanensis TaxID=992287 RepID=A0A919U479_9CELL|nr:malonic semialdehyde reductase [Cellulomonas pakistanensis]GIG37181.1 nitroreductase family protein [Cellulomonas pakistanensis]
MSTDTAPLTDLRVPQEVVDLVFRDARTVNTFAEGEVTDEQVRAVWDVVRWGPTAMNSLPLRLLLVRSPEGRERLVAHMNEGNKAKTQRAPLSVVVAADLDFHEQLHRLAPHVPGARDNFAGVADVRARWSRDNAFLQAGYLIVGLRAAGLHVGPMTGFDAPGLDADLLAGSGWRSLMVLNVGTMPADADGTPASHPRQGRLDFEDVARTI